MKISTENFLMKIAFPYWGDIPDRLTFPFFLWKLFWEGLVVLPVKSVLYYLIIVPILWLDLRFWNKEKCNHVPVTCPKISGLRITPVKVIVILILGIVLFHHWLIIIKLGLCAFVTVVFIAVIIAMEPVDYLTHTVKKLWGYLYARYYIIEVDPKCRLSWYNK